MIIINKKKSQPRNAKEAVRRLALGSVGDAIKLMMLGENITQEDLETLDLFCVSDIKKGPGGITEVKFFDRLKAIEYMEEMKEKKVENGNDFIDALRKVV